MTVNWIKLFLDEIHLTNVQMWFYHRREKQIYLKHWAVLEKHSVKISGNNDLSWKGLGHGTDQQPLQRFPWEQHLHTWLQHVDNPKVYIPDLIVTDFWAHNSLAVYLHASRGNKGRTHESGFLCSASGVLGWLTPWEIMYLFKGCCFCSGQFWKSYSFTQQILLKHLQSSKLSIKWWAEQTQSLSSVRVQRNIFGSDCKLWEKIAPTFMTQRAVPVLLWCMNLNNVWPFETSIPEI